MITTQVRTLHVELATVLERHGEFVRCDDRPIGERPERGLDRFTGSTE